MSKSLNSENLKMFFVMNEGFVVVVVFAVIWTIVTYGPMRFFVA